MIRIHREGKKIVAATILLLLAVTIAVALFLPPAANYLSSLLCLTVLVFVLRFFRAPRRKPFLDDRTVVAPADGKVVAVERTEEDEFFTGPCIQVSVFMSIHDVHVNYFPVKGRIRYLRYHPGKYLLARHPKSSRLNERFSTGIDTPYGPVLVRQIAGTVARRIRSYARQDAMAGQGEEMGFIRFGSRLDLFIPVNAEVRVTIGQRVTGSITPVATFNKG